MAFETENNFVGAIVFGDDGVTTPVLSASSCFAVSTFLKTGPGRYQCDLVEPIDPFTVVPLANANTVATVGSPIGVAAGRVAIIAGVMRVFLECNNGAGAAANALLFQCALLRTRTDT